MYYPCTENSSSLSDLYTTQIEEAFENSERKGANVCSHHFLHFSQYLVKMSSVVKIYLRKEKKMMVAAFFSLLM